MAKWSRTIRSERRVSKESIIFKHVYLIHRSAFYNISEAEDHCTHSETITIYTLHRPLATIKSFAAIIYLFLPLKENHSTQRNSNPRLPTSFFSLGYAVRSLHWPRKSLKTDPDARQSLLFYTLAQRRERAALFIFLWRFCHHRSTSGDLTARKGNRVHGITKWERL